MRVRELRHNATDAEQLMWRLLRHRQLGGVKFRRQHPIGKFILDFYCFEHKLALELDGGGHTEARQSRYDTERTRALAGEGIRVLRFWNNEVLNNTEEVLQRIWVAVHEEAVPSPLAPPPTEEGEKTPSSHREKGWG